MYVYSNVETNDRNLFHENQYQFIPGCSAPIAEFDLIKDLHHSTNLIRDSCRGGPFFLSDTFILSCLIIV